MVLTGELTPPRRCMVAVWPRGVRGARWEKLTPLRACCAPRRVLCGAETPFECS